MRAAVYHGVTAGLSIEEVPDPVPGHREVVLRVERCGVCGSDVHMTDGVGMMESPIGTVLGHEYSGEVVDVGKEVTSVIPGDRVTALAMSGCGACAACARGDLLACTGAESDKVPSTGAYAEYVRTVDVAVVKLPEDVDYETGALVEPLAVALHGVDLADVRSGDNVTILGAGPIALSTLAWLRARGVEDVVVVARSTRRRRHALDLGASQFVQIDPTDASTFPAPAGIVFEAAGSAGAITVAFGLARRNGMVVSFGFSDVEEAFIPALVLIKGLRLQFSMMYNRQDFEKTIAVLQRDLVQVNSLVSQTVSLDELPSAFAALHDTNDHCKVMIDPWAPRQ
jgi:threonine dehydrogenase-like Zn-dependent dehydrogenase